MIVSDAMQLSRTPSPIIVTAGGDMSPTDLRMMHFWSTVTCNSVAIGPGAKNAMQRALPQLSFEHDFLLNGMLGTASLQLQKMDPTPETRKQTDIYRSRSLNSFRQALSRVRIGTKEYEAVLIMSLLVVVLSSQDDSDALIVVNWFVLFRGLSTIISLQAHDFDKVSRLSVGPIFQRELAPLKSKPVVPTILLNMFQGMEPWDPDYRFLESYCQILDAMGILYASLKDDGLSNNLYVRVVSWPSYSNQDFANQAKAKRPRALIILAHYLLFVKFARMVWWVEGIPAKEIVKIAAMIGPEWAPYIEVPLLALTMDNDEDIAKLMLQ